MKKWHVKLYGILHSIYNEFYCKLLKEHPLNTEYWIGILKPDPLTVNEQDVAQQFFIKAFKDCFMATIVKDEEGKFTPQEFDKDSIVHLNFVYGATVLYRKVYNSTELLDPKGVQKVAGNIQLSLLTTTSIVSGLQCIELYKCCGFPRVLESFPQWEVDTERAIFYPLSAQTEAESADFTPVWEFDYGKDASIEQIKKAMEERFQIEIEYFCWLKNESEEVEFDSEISRDRTIGELVISGSPSIARCPLPEYLKAQIDYVGQGKTQFAFIKLKLYYPNSNQ